MLERATRKPAAKKQVKSGKAAKPRKKKVVAFFPEGGLRAGAQLGRHRPGAREARPQGGVPVRPGLSRCLSRLWFRGPSGQSVGAAAAGGDGASSGSDFINGHIPNFRKSPYEQIDNYVKDCWEMIVRDRQMGGEGSAASARQGEARRHLRRQCHPVSGDQALCARAWQAVGADHLMLGERDRGSGHSAASVGLRRQGQERLPALSQALQRGDQADPRRLQRLPRNRSARRNIRSASSSRPRRT